MFDNKVIHIIIIVIILLVIFFISNKESFQVEHTRTSNSVIKYGDKYLGISDDKLNLLDEVIYFNLSSDLKKGNKNIFYNISNDNIILSNTYPRILGPVYIKLSVDNDNRISGILADSEPKKYYLKAVDSQIKLTENIDDSTVFTINST
jgi:hypothetical protein